MQPSHHRGEHEIVQTQTFAGGEGTHRKDHRLVEASVVVRARGDTERLGCKRSAFDYVGAFACTGVPHDGYTMNLASCFWRHGLGQEAYFGSEAREYFPFEASNTGTAKGIAKLSGATLQNQVSPDAVYDKQK
jgi:hypothetical protein